MQLAHSVRPNAQSQGEGGHVEGAKVSFGTNGEIQHALQRYATSVGFTGAIAQRANDTLHEVNAELLIAG